MESPVRRRLLTAEAVDTVADVAAWAVALSLLGLLLLYSLRPPLMYSRGIAATVRGAKVAEGETVQTISYKCGDPFIVERNPDDVFPGLVIELRPSSGSCN